MSGFSFMLNLNSNIEIMVLQPSSWCHMKALSKCYVSINKSIKVSIKIFTQSNSENGFRSDVNLGDKCQDFLFLPKNSPSHSLLTTTLNQRMKRRCTIILFILRNVA